MQHIAAFTKSIFEVSADTFDTKALAVFRYQAAENNVYRQFLQFLDISADDILHVDDIPFLPISAFRHHKVMTGAQQAVITFESSGTGQTERSYHGIADPKIYEASCLLGFRRVYGDPADYCILALLPSYLERANASLVYMCDMLIKRSGHPDSGFYLHDMETLHAVLQQLNASGTKTLLIGVSFALLDLASAYPMDLPHVTIIETGGMKGRREEITRESLHQILSSAFHKEVIHSEYGMTELLSQAYSTGNGIFHAPTWMQVRVRDTEDPFRLLAPGQSGCLNIIDLANIHSCSFIATDDIGKLHADGSFSVLGRFDKSDVRGCNLMVE